MTQVSGRVTDLKRLAEMSDDEIDLSDIPEWTDEDFANARVQHPESPHAVTMAFAVDPENIEWLRNRGGSLAEVLNRLIRRERETEQTR